MGGLNINIKAERVAYDKFDVFCDLDNPLNLIHSETCLNYSCHWPLFIPPKNIKKL